MTGTRRPNDSGRRDSLGRTIRTADDTHTRADAPPPPENTPRRRPFVHQQPRHPNPNAGVNTIGQFVAYEDLLAEAKRCALQPGESAGYTIDHNGNHTGGMTILTPDYGNTLADQLAHEGVNNQTMRIITRDDDGYTFTDWPNEPDNLELTQNDTGSWEANNGTTRSNYYDNRDAAIAGFHRNNYTAQRGNRISSNTDHVTEQIKALPDDVKELIGDIRIGYIGNVGGGRDDRHWSISTPDWTDPRSVHNNNPASRPLGDTTDIARASTSDLDTHLAEFIDKTSEAIRNGDYQRRLRG